jgi:ABC-type transport system involved in multi-copper enzyme maturation permease subunit
MDFAFRMNPQLKPIFTQQDLFAFPDIWSFTTYCASFFNILLCVVIVVITCNEIQHKTMRQNIIDGLSKQQVIMGKFVLVLFFSILATLITFLTGLIIGGCTNGFSNMYENIHLVVLYFVQTLGYFSFAFLFALIVKRPAIAIITFILFFPVEFIIGQLVTDEVYQFFPLKVYADLTPLPFFKQVLAATSQNNLWLMDMSQKMMLSGFYVIVFFSLTYMILKRRDL